ncbi:response regulator [Paenibacillus gansuensis]|uniref:Response regulator n=1 Tax=Paenibacillus gansuensis TaxID=306542 RepID=A0ABW5P822_9BACL
MLKLLIVDDHMHLVDDMAESLDWNGLGITSVYKAYSSDDALEILNEQAVHIVITDIQMPGMSGLELVQEIRKKWPGVKCILISGYDDFQYAQQAIQNRVEDYLLKPVSDEQILGKVREVILQIREEWEHVASFQRAVHTFRENLPRLRETLLLELLRGFRHGNLEEKLQRLELPFQPGDSVSLLFIRFDDDYGAYHPHDIALLEYAVSNIAAELLADSFETWHCKDEHGYMVVAVKAKGHGESGLRKDQLDKAGMLLMDNTRMYLNKAISVTISTWGTFPHEIPGMYRHSILNIVKRIGNESECFYSETSALSAGEEQLQSLVSLYQPPALPQLLEAGRWSEAEAKLHELDKELSRKWTSSREHLLEAFLAVSSAFTFIAHKNGRSIVEIAGDDWNRVIGGAMPHSVQQLSEWSQRVLRKLKEDMESEIQLSRSSIVREVHQFVEDHLSEDVSLKSIADHIYLHPVYLSRIYKLETGQGLSDYILQLRMEKAAHWLRNTHEKIYEIAMKLGYHNPNYFAKTFKKHFGMTPQEYRS